MSDKQKIWILLAFSAMAIILVALVPPFPQPLSYHDFADKRSLWGIPNAANVMSNLPFLAVGTAGMLIVRRKRLAWGIPLTYQVLFAGVFLTGIGSAYYHWRPDNNTLVWDRIPLTIVFMAFLSATITELVSRPWGLRLLPVLVSAGIASVWYWHYGDTRGRGDLRVYGLVQFFPVACIPLVLALFYDPSHRRIFSILGWVVAWYVLAKIAETADWPVYRATGISGHTLKHFAAAVSAWYFVVLFSEKYGKKDAQ
jgi:hypothetical protein